MNAFMTNSVFSYIIPFHNSRGTLRRSLESVLRNMNFIEIVLIDDCSCDGSVDTIKDILDKEHNVVYCRNDLRRGAGVSRNIGAHCAKGNILVYVDADVVIPSYTSAMLEGYFSNQMASPAPDAVVANREKEGLSRNPVSLYKNYWTSYNFSKLNGWTSFLNTSLLAIRKDVLLGVGGFLDIGSGEDSELGLRLFGAGHKIYFSRELAVFHDKTYTLFSLLKREFLSGRDSIKIKLRNRMFHELVKERKFFAVNSNFIYSLPLTLVLTFSFFLFIFSRQIIFLPILFLVLGGLVFLNAEFFSYAAPANIFRKGLYLFFLVLQLNILACAMAIGMIDLGWGRLFHAFCFTGRYARSFLRIFMKGIFPPERVTLFLTERCNLKCMHCFLEKEDGHLAPELDLNEYELIAHSMKGVNHLVLTGGEPFLRDDIVDIVRVLACYARPLTITILTNGYSTASVVEKVNRVLSFYQQPLWIKISMDGLRDTHDRIRRKDGAFERARATFVELKKLKRRHRNLSLGIITTYTHGNMDCIPLFYDDVVAVLGPDQYSLVLERSKGACELNEKIDVDAYARLLKKISYCSFSGAHGFLEKLRVAYKIRIADKVRDIYSKNEYPMDCWAGTVDAVINSGGDVLCCEQLKGKMGNLREVGYDLRKLWYSMQAKRVRQQVRGVCFCTNECNMPFNLVFSVKEIWGVVTILLGLYISTLRSREQGCVAARDEGQG